MSQKFPEQKQYFIFLDYLRFKYSKYNTNILEVSSGDFGSELLPIFGYVQINDLNFTETLKTLEHNGLIQYEEKGLSFGVVTLKSSFFKEVEKMDQQLKTNQKPISPTTIMNINNANGFIEKHTNSKKSWQDNLAVYIIVGVAIILISYVILEHGVVILKYISTIVVP